MSTTINSISCYATKTRGTAQSFIRVAVVNAADVANMDTDETAGGSAAGVQTVDFDASAVGGNDAGLVTATYTASINLDGTAYPISVDVTTADTFTTVIGLINADLPGTELAISGGNLVVTSPTTGLASYVAITDVDLFVGMSGYAGLLGAVDGGLLGQLSTRTLANGSNALSAYSPAEEVYDASADKEEIAANVTDNTGGTAGSTIEDVTATPTQTLVNNNFATLADKIDALQNVVEKAELAK